MSSIAFMLVEIEFNVASHVLILFSCSHAHMQPCSFACYNCMRTAVYCGFVNLLRYILVGLATVLAQNDVCGIVQCSTVEPPGHLKGVISGKRKWKFRFRVKGPFPEKIPAGISAVLAGWLRVLVLQKQGRTLSFSEPPPEGGLDLVTKRQGDTFFFPPEYKEFGYFGRLLDNMTKSVFLRVLKLKLFRPFPPNSRRSGYASLARWHLSRERWLAVGS